MDNEKEIYYIDEYNMLRMLDEPWWQVDDGKGDSLFGTSLAYMLYGEERLLGGIKSCFDQQCAGHHHVVRHPTLPYGDVSRDQVSAALIALKYRGHECLVQRYSNLKWKLSPRFSQTIDFYLWVKSLSKGVAWAWAFHAVAIITMAPTVAWNWLIRSIAGFTSAHQSQFDPGAFFLLPNWKKKATKLLYPPFALFLLSLQVMVSPDTGLKWMLNRILVAEAEEDNLFIRNLAGKLEMDFTYKSMRGIRWNDRLDQTNNNGLRILEDGEAGKYDLDAGLLWFSMVEGRKVRNRMEQ